jgi:hypothetical protein
MICPRCGVQLVARNLSHSCGDYSIDKFLRGKTAAERALFERFVALIPRPYSVAPAKTRVAFCAQVRFASVNRVGSGTIDIHFVLPRVIEDPRVRRIDHLGKLHVHHVRLARAEDCDAQLAGWLRAAYDEYGERAWLTPARSARRSRGSSGRKRTGRRARR